MASGSHRRVKIPYSGAPYGTCRWCGEPIKKRDHNPDKRRRWHQHSWERNCLREYLMASDHKYVLQERIREGLAHCVECGRNPPSLPAAVYEAYGYTFKANHTLRYDLGFGHWPGLDVGITQALYRAVHGRGYGYVWRPTLVPPLQVDHIIPLIDGGTFDEDNLQLLCPQHHRAKTAREAKERAARKREAKETARPKRPFEQLSL